MTSAALSPAVIFLRTSEPVMYDVPAQDGRITRTASSSPSTGEGIQAGETELFYQNPDGSYSLIR